MKIIEKTGSAKFVEKYDYRSMLEISVNGKREVCAMDGEPEDATLGRDFNDMYKIVDLMMMAYAAGVAGESLEIERIQVDE